MQEVCGWWSARCIHHGACTGWGSTARLSHLRCAHVQAGLCASVQAGLCASVRAGAQIPAGRRVIREANISTRAWRSLTVPNLCTKQRLRSGYRPPPTVAHVVQQQCRTLHASPEASPRPRVNRAATPTAEAACTSHLKPVNVHCTDAPATCGRQRDTAAWTAQPRHPHPTAPQPPAAMQAQIYSHLHVDLTATRTRPTAIAVDKTTSCPRTPGSGRHYE